jgi:hypothetical protein
VCEEKEKLRTGQMKRVIKEKMKEYLEKNELNDEGN